MLEMAATSKNYISVIIVCAGSEDCLFLNVYTPMVDPATPLPVMVFIHGGYLQFGDGAMPGYSPDERLTNNLQMVFVSIQYRYKSGSEASLVAYSTSQGLRPR